jgi:hypothetical protein
MLVTGVCNHKRIASRVVVTLPSETGVPVVVDGNECRCRKALFKIYRHTGYKIFRRNIAPETKKIKNIPDSVRMKMKKADYIAIALFVASHCVGALL